MASTGTEPHISCAAKRLTYVSELLVLRWSTVAPNVSIRHADTTVPSVPVSPPFQGTLSGPTRDGRNTIRTYLGQGTLSGPTWDGEHYPEPGREEQVTVVTADTCAPGRRHRACLAFHRLHSVHLESKQGVSAVGRPLGSIVRRPAVHNGHRSRIKALL